MPDGLLLGEKMFIKTNAGSMPIRLRQPRQRSNQQWESQREVLGAGEVIKGIAKVTVARGGCEMKCEIDGRDKVNPRPQ